MWMQVKALVPTIDELVEQQRAAARVAKTTGDGSPTIKRKEPLSYDRAPSPSLDFEDIHDQFYNNDEDLLADESSSDSPLVPDPSRPAAQDQHILDLIRAATDPTKQINMCSTWHPWF